MQRLRAALLALSVCSPLTASAADVTRLASSFEDDDPFGLFLDLGFERTQHHAKLVREQFQDGEIKEVGEVWYKGVDSRLNLGFAVGLYRDLEFRYAVPVVFQQNESWDYVSGTNASNSSITNNCLAANGTLTDPACVGTGVGAQPLFGVPNNTYRGGLGNMRFGFAYAFFNQRRDDTKPTWIVGLDYEAPTAKLLNPTEPTTESDRGDIGDRTHKYQFYTAFSRRIGAVEPYFKAHYTLPFRGPGWYSNCDNPNSTNMARPENCNTPNWTREETGIQVPHRVGVLMGSEFNLYDVPAQAQKFAIDVRGITQYVSGGRYYNELSGVLNELLKSEDYLQVGGMIGFTARTTDFFQLRASGTLLYNTDHVITGESLGKDITGPDGQKNGSVDLSSPEEINPNFDFRTDMVSRQFRATNATVFRFELNASFVF